MQEVLRILEIGEDDATPILRKYKWCVPERPSQPLQLRMFGTVALAIIFLLLILIIEYKFPPFKMLEGQQESREAGKSSPGPPCWIWINVSPGTR